MKQIFSTEMPVLTTKQQTVAAAPVRRTANHQAQSPDDLRSVVGERGLVELALQSVQHFGADLPMWHKTTEPELSSRMLLALLTYCYAAGIYSSEDIHWACRSDGGAKYLSANPWPDQRALKRFRRQWRSQLLACLEWVCAEVETVRRSLLPEQRIETAILMDLAGD